MAVFSIAHLGDAERMFFVSLLLNQMVGVDARADAARPACAPIVYMDEILGYFPPVANPPSKAPLLTLLKQGRAFGLGVVLATQNPVDLDYKGLANTGTWFLGRLQTERDKARMLDGLEGAAGGSMDRAETDRLLSALDKRVFLLHNVHDKAPIVFQTRWTLSYLRGPLSRDQIRALTPRRRGRRRRSPRGGRTLPRQRRCGSRAIEDGPGAGPPASERRRSFRPASSSISCRPRPAARSRYRPVVLGAARVGFGDTKLGIDEVRDVIYAAPIIGAVACRSIGPTARSTSGRRTAQRPADGRPARRYEEVPSPGSRRRTTPRGTRSSPDGSRRPRSSS